MAKISLALVIALLVVVPLHSVLSQDDPWKSVIDQAKIEAKKAGISQETIYEAEKTVTDGSAVKAAEDALGEGSLNDWVQQANDMADTDGSAAIETSEDLPDDEEEDNLSEAPEMAPSQAPEGAPINAPSEAPSAAPQAQTPSAATF